MRLIWLLSLGAVIAGLSSASGGGEDAVTVARRTTVAPVAQPGYAGRKHVTLVGDSLNVGIEPYLGARLRGWTISTDDAVGRSGATGLAELAALNHALAPVVVISLGTNDVQTDVTGFRNLVEAAVAQAGPRRCVIWSTIWLHGPNLAFNRVLREAAGRHRNLEIADWAGLVGASPQLLAPDGIHGTPQGYQEKAAQVAGIVEHSCGRVTTLPGLADKPGTLANHPGE